MSTVSVVSGTACSEVGMAEGRREMARGSADLAHSCDAPRVEPTDL